ncbi:MAG: zinc metalloprotease HtpX [Bacillota bacterium]|nr:zinc metalloprotease HtpX [Bacillota bacterium]
MELRFRDPGLSFRMGLTVFLLFGLYALFVWVLLSAGAGYGFTFVVVGAMMGLQYFYSDKLVLLSSGANEVTPAQYPELHAMVARLAQLADVPKPRVAVVPTAVPNAFATGRDPQHAVVAVTEGLLRTLTPEEVEAVLAHEITHVRNRDVTVMTLASFFGTLAGYLMRWFFWFGGPVDRRDRNGNAVALVYLVSLVVWLLSFFLLRALSRYREFAADRGSALLTGAPSHLASALLKISGTMDRMPKRDLREAEGLNAFYIVPMLSGESLMELLATHPSLQRRLQYLEKIEREMRGQGR